MIQASRTVFFLACLIASVLGFSLRARADWQLVWSDEFDGTAIDTNKWTYDTGNGPAGLAGWGNNELEYYRSQNAYVSNGILNMVARQEAFGGQNYTSARIKTLGLFSKKYGRFEFRARLPAGQGYWPAIWMMPRDSVYGGWAASGEIDITENRGSDPATVLGTIHFGGHWPTNQQSHGPSFVFPAGDGVTNFHTYALEWLTNSIKWSIDGQVYETQTSWSSVGGPYPAPFDQQFYIIMNLAVGGNFGGNPDTNTIFPGTMQVDYVRAYDLISTPPPPPVLRLRFPLDDGSGASSLSDANGGAASVALQMVNGSGVAADYHGAASSGVSGQAANRALDFSSNGANQPGNPGPLAAVTNSNLGFGLVSNYVVTLWFKQKAMMALGSSVGPRMFVLGGGTPSDTGVANSLGLKFQTASQLSLQMNSITALATYATNLPTNAWLFIAAVCDGANIMLYTGSDVSPVTLVSTTPASGSVDFGTNGCVYLGNRQNRQRSFDGWIDDFRFYTGTADANFVESVRLQALNPASTSVSIQSSGSNVTLTWPVGVLQSGAGIGGPWFVVSNATSPYTLTATGQQQFFRAKLQ